MLSIWSGTKFCRVGMGQVTFSDGSSLLRLTLVKTLCFWKNLLHVTEPLYLVILSFGFETHIAAGVIFIHFSCNDVFVKKQPVSWKQCCWKYAKQTWKP